MVQLASNSKPGDVAVIAAAVSDYWMQEVHKWKISSQQTELSLHLQKLPKIIDLMRQVSESLVVIGFKLLPVWDSHKKTHQALIDASLKQMHWPSQTDLVIANSSSSQPGKAGIGIQDTLMVYPDGEHKIINRRQLWDLLLQELPWLIEKRLATIST